MGRRAILFGVLGFAVAYGAAACGTGGGPTIGHTDTQTQINYPVPSDPLAEYPPTVSAVPVFPPTYSGRADAEAGAQDSGDEAESGGH